MSSAFDESDSLVSYAPVRQGNHVYGWIRPDSGEIELSWDSQEFNGFLNTNRAKLNLAKIFEGVPHRSKTQVDANAAAWIHERRLQNSVLKLVFVGWLAFFPAVWAMYEFFGPEWVGFAVLLFALWKALRAGLKLVGYVKPSRSESAKAERERKMQHYFYHCERNPIGFAALRGENFTEDSRQRTRKEAAVLAETSRANNPDRNGGA